MSMGEGSVDAPTLHKSTLQVCMGTFGFHPTEEDMEDITPTRLVMFRSVDKNSDGVINEAETIAGNTRSG